MDILIIKWGKKRPEEALITNFKNSKHIVLWKDGSNKTIFDIISSENDLKNIINDSDDVVIIGYKRYCDYFGPCNCQALFDYPMEIDSLKNGLKNALFHRDQLGKEWQQIRADAAEVYSMIEKRGILISGVKEYPKYHMDVYSGRSRTTEFNIQGASIDYDVRHPDDKMNMLIKFDWVAADMRMASYLSKDKNLMKSYEESDPYSFIMESVGSGKADRDQCKLALNRAVNSLNNNDLIFRLFPEFGEWVSVQKRNLDQRGYVESILGRRFFTDHTLKGDRRAFNGTLQGSVAHAMQAVISRVNAKCGDIILAEQHDSLTVAVSESRLIKTIKTIVDIMVNPWGDLNMPVVVEIGKTWGRYKRFKEYR